MLSCPKKSTSNFIAKNIDVHIGTPILSLMIQRTNSFIFKTKTKTLFKFVKLLFGHYLVNIFALINTWHNLRIMFKVLRLAEQSDSVLILQHAVGTHEIWPASLLLFKSPTPWNTLHMLFLILKNLKLYSFLKCLLLLIFRQCQTCIVIFLKWFVFYLVNVYYFLS